MDTNRITAARETSKALIKEAGSLIELAYGITHPVTVVGHLLEANTTGIKFQPLGTMPGFNLWVPYENVISQTRLGFTAVPLPMTKAAGGK
jgi:hypothetical protein